MLVAVEARPLNSSRSQALGEQQPPLHLAFLDSLRGIAILLVLFVHSGEVAYVSLSSATWKLASMGQRGVELFYMVSAFTLFLSLDRARPEPRPVLAFYVRRFFRIAPAFYFALLLELLLYGFWHPDRYRYGLAFVFLNGWSSRAINLSILGSWSVAVEWTFYLFVPVLHRSIRTLRSALIWFTVSSLLCTVVSFFLAKHARYDQSEYFQLLWFPVQFPIFLLGILTYMVWKQLQSTGYLNLLRNPSQRQTAAVLLLGLAAVLFLSNVEWRDGQRFFNLRLIPCSISFALLILAGGVWEWPVLFNRFTRYLGRISYSLYLAHFFLLSAWFRLVRPPSSPWLRGSLGTVTCFCGLLLITIPISHLMWLYLEQPGIRLGRLLIKRIEHRAFLPAGSIADRAGL